MSRIICLRVAHAVCVLRTAIRGTCSRCGEPIWISPSSLNMAGERNDLWCVQCYVDVTPNGVHSLRKVQPTPEQAEEMRQHFAEQN